MALLDKIKNLGKYRTYIARQERGKTLNEQISTGEINAQQPEIISGFSKTLDQQINDGSINQQDDLLKNIPDNSLDTFTIGSLDPTQQVIEDNGRELVRKVATTQEKEEEGLWNGIKNFFTAIPSYVSNFTKGQIADSEAQASEQRVALGYNKDNGNMLYLDLNEDRGLFDYDWGTRSSTEDLFNRYQQEFNAALNNPYATQENINQARQDFYNNTKDLFRLRADDYYSDGFLFNTNGERVGRRKDNYTDTQLEKLAANNLEKGRYTPTFDERLDYIQAQYTNAENKRNIYAGYGLAVDEDDSTIKLSEGVEQDWFGGFQNRALVGINETIQQYIRNKNPNAGNEAMLNIYSAVNDQATRLWAIIQPIYTAEQVVLAKPVSERTTGEKKLLETADLFRRMERAAADGINNWAIQEIKYGTNSKGEIVESLDVFDNGESLSDVLSSEVKKLSGRERNDRESNIDVFQEMANEALYDYYKGKGTRGTRAWRWTQHGLEGVGSRLGEAGQQVGIKIGQAANLISDALTFHRGSLADRITGEKAVSITAAYLDQDFTIGRLIETDDGNAIRTIKKYLLQGAEYTPEALGNLLPDIAIGTLTEGAGLVTTLRHIPQAVRAVKAVKATSMLNKVKVATNALKGGMRGIEGLKNAVAGIKNINEAWRVGGEILDRALTQGLIDQAMDAQRSAFDTEAYSGLSEALSIFGTIGMNILPELYKGQLGSLVKKTINPNRITGSIWDLADYISSSPQAAENIANVLGKNIQDIGLDDLRVFAKNFGDIEGAAKQAYEQLPIEGKDAANKWTKALMYNYINQIYGGNSEIAKTARIILNNGATNAADLFKYLGKIPGEVSFGPYVSTIKLKHGTQADVIAKDGSYNSILDSIAGGFDSKLRNGFTQADIDAISKLEGFGDVLSKQSSLFYEVGDKRYLTLEGLDRFGIEAENATLETIGVALSDAENIKELFKERMKGIKNKNISDDTIDAIADSGAYDEIVNKVKEIVC